MGPRIALLLSGEPADLSTSICAVQLAARSDSKLYALQDYLAARQDETTPIANTDKSAMESSFSFVVEFAGSEGVQISCHLLENKTIAQMIEFLVGHAITCLIVSKGYEKSGRRSARLVELQRRLTSAPRRFHADLQIIEAPLLEEADIKQIIRQFRRLD